MSSLPDSRFDTPATFFSPKAVWIEGERRSASTSTTLRRARARVWARAMVVVDLPSRGRVLVTASDLGVPWAVASSRLASTAR